MADDIFIFAGEKSGDLHGERIVKALQALNPTSKIIGVGGPRMRAEGMECILPMEEFQVMGFVDVFFALPKLIRQFYFIGKTILKLNPKVVLFIDYPGFNLRMARYLKKNHYTGKLFHFICPSVWAWGKKRIPLMAKNLDQLLTILPFEKQYFSNTSLPVEFIGHPLVQRLKEHTYRTIPLLAGHTVLAVFPGSRKKELERNFPMQLSVCKQLKLKYPNLLIAVSVSDERFGAMMLQMIDQSGLAIGQDIALIPAELSYDLMQCADAAIAKSGTVTLELALHAVPTVVTYAISAIDLLIARDILRIRLPHYCLVNIMGGREIYPELFGPNFTEKNLYTHTDEMLNNPQRRSQCRQACQELAQSLLTTDACQEVARHCTIS